MDKDQWNRNVRAFCKAAFTAAEWIIVIAAFRYVSDRFDSAMARIMYYILVIAFGAYAGTYIPTIASMSRHRRAIQILGWLVVIIGLITFSMFIGLLSKTMADSEWGTTEPPTKAVESASPASGSHAPKALPLVDLQRADASAIGTPAADPTPQKQ